MFEAMWKMIILFLYGNRTGQRFDNDIYIYEENE